jgi:hypothetical protein
MFYSTVNIEDYVPYGVPIDLVQWKHRSLDVLVSRAIIFLNFSSSIFFELMGANNSLESFSHSRTLLSLNIIGEIG